MKQDFCFSFYENLASIHTIEYQWSGVRTTYEEMVGRIFALQKKEGLQGLLRKTLHHGASACGHHAEDL